MKKTPVLILIILFLLFPVMSQGGGIELGHLGGGDSRVYGINSAGLIVGVSANSKLLNRAFVIVPEDNDADGQPDTWFVDDGQGKGINKLMIDLGVMGTNSLDDESYAVGINDDGVIIGWGDYLSFILTPKDFNGDGIIDYFLPGTNGENKLMEPLAYKDCWVMAINNLKQVTGFYKETGDLLYQPFVWDSLLKKLENPVAKGSGYGIGINDHGDVVGTIEDSNRQYIGTVWLKNNSYKAVPITDPMFEEAIVWDINNHLQIAGIYGKELWGYEQPFTLKPLESDGLLKWRSGTGNNALIQIISTGYKGEAYRVTDRGHVVGWLEVDDLDPYGQRKREGFLWSEQDGLVNLGSVSCLTPQMVPKPGLRNEYNCSEAMDMADYSNLAFIAGNNDISEKVGRRGYLWGIPIVPPTPQQQIDEIGDQVDDIVNNPDSNLGENDANALNTTLNASADKFAKGNTNAGCNVLKAFKNQVAAKVKSGKLTPGEGQALVDAANSMSECQ